MHLSHLTWDFFKIMCLRACIELRRKIWEAIHACMYIFLQIEHDFHESSLACLKFIFIWENHQVLSCFVVFDHDLGSSRPRKPMHVVFMNIHHVLSWNCEFITNPWAMILWNNPKFFMCLQVYYVISSFGTQEMCFEGWKSSFELKGAIWKFQN